METETFPICRLHVGHTNFGIQKATPAHISQHIKFSQPRYEDSVLVRFEAVRLGECFQTFQTKEMPSPSWTHWTLTMKALHAFETSIST